MDDVLRQKIDDATAKVVSVARSMTAHVDRGQKGKVEYDAEASWGLFEALKALERLEAQDREEREGAAVDELLEKIGHVEGCDYTLKATAFEMAVHAALFLQYGGPLPSCGDVDWWADGDALPKHAFVSRQVSNRCLLFVAGGGTCGRAPDDPLHQFLGVQLDDDAPGWAGAGADVEAQRG